MKQISIPILLVGLLLFLARCSEKADTSPADSIENILEQMTLEEKVGQMTNLTLSTIADDKGGSLKVDSVKLQDVIIDHHIGSLQNVVSNAYSLQDWHKLINSIQKLTLEKTRLKIPFLYCIDAVHGTNYTLGSTIFPHNLNLAATRNPDLVEECSRITAKETRASGIRYNFSPVLDVGRNALWPRFPETFGEDVELVRVMGARSVKGYQQENLAAASSVAACMKHFIGYSVPASGRDRAPAYIPEIILREYFLPPFEEAVKLGARTLMVNSADVNGIPVHASKYLLTQVLRKELGFQGIIISDWQDILKLHERHKVAASHKEAVLMAVNAGIDMCIVPFDFSFYEDLIALVKEGKISESRINESVRRILAMKKDLGLFSDPYVENEAIQNFGKPEYKSVALKAATESLVLLKNESEALPLKPGAKVLLLGPSADSRTALHGAWTYTWQGTKEDFFSDSTLSILKALQRTTGEENVTFHKGTDWKDSLMISYTLLSKLSKDAEAIIVCAGEGAYAETPGNTPDLELSEAQVRLIRQAASTGKKVILVLTEGRPRIIRSVEPLCQAIIFAGWPGSQGAQAITDVVFGISNPSGKLPFTYPRFSSELITYDHKPLDEAIEIVEPEYNYSFSFNPQFPFGHGLSYTHFSYTDLNISDSVLKENGKITVRVSVQNTGSRAGEEVVELYIRDLYASVVPPVKRLKKFQKIMLSPGQKQTVELVLTAEDLSFIAENLQRISEPGKFEVIIKDLKKYFTLE